MTAILHRRRAQSAEVVGAKTRTLLSSSPYLFGVGEGGTGCRIAKPISEGLQFRYVTALLRLQVPGKTIDERYEEVLAEQVKGSGLSKVAILGQDAVYDGNGRPDWVRTSFYVPNDYVFAVVDS